MATTTLAATSVSEIETRNASVFTESRSERSTFYTGEQLDAVLRFLGTRVRGYDGGEFVSMSQNWTFMIYANLVDPSAADIAKRFEYSVFGMTYCSNPVVERVKLSENRDMSPGAERGIGDGSTVWLTVLASNEFPAHPVQCNIACADVHRQIILSTPL